MPLLNDLKPFLRHVEAIQTHDPSFYVPFVVAGHSVGMVRREFVGGLAPYSDVLRIGDTVELIAGPTFGERTLALAGVTADLAARNHFDLRGESYSIGASWGETALATIDRGAYAFFGTEGYGVHVNGLVRKSNGLHLWIARRARDRIVAAGKLDNIIGGGLGAGYTAHEVLIKESAEEANVPADLAATAIAAGAISYAYDVKDGVKRDTLFVYDLSLPEDFVPVNTDGEVESFELLPIAEVLRLVSDTDDFKTNVNAVIIDLAIRYGIMQPDMPGYAKLVSGLRRPH